MKRLITVLVVLAVLLIAVLVAGPFYTLNEGEQAVVVRLGQIVDVKQDAGLHIKSPFLDDVIKYPKKIMSWDGEKQRIPTKENQFIWVDTIARWKISDPKKFYESIGNLESAYARLGDVIDSAVRTIIAENWLRETVRNSNIIRESKGSTESFEVGSDQDAGQLSAFTRTDVTYEEVQKGRRKLAEEMLNLSRKLVPEYGIELIDVVPRQIKYSDELTQSVYNRMIKERSQIAQAFRSFGEGKKAEWEGKLENERRSLLSAAYEKAEKIKGTADAEATRIYAQAYSKDPEFFEFWRSIESYKTTLPKFNKTLSTDMDYFRYLYSPRGR
ncbi:MAG: protease modulator HflC [Spirochaetota bacterium]|jgi:membrane protease subunit HflC|uniref:protease modulator HflC n=1 Tax=Gracilinema caldarium TaxID=215591 RepID=UPI001699D964|nr:protease modulator HflC [Gracilinema caldarium]NLJ09573.1 protease modulator HflC [Treponema sp.]